jgi:FkbM family methyltransferase
MRSFSRFVWKAGRVILPVLQKIKKALGMRTEYRYRRYSILLPADHLLPIYQKYHKRYDRFLPHLVKYLEPGVTVIDVGANCGDTLAAMYELNSKINYVCIEPDDTFFGYLGANVRRIKVLENDASISIIKALVGKEVRSAALEGSGGTKHAVLSDDATVVAKRVSSVTLDELLAGQCASNVHLLKSDVDGFDYDVMDSAEGLIKEQTPILYFECYFGNELQKMAYKKTIARLVGHGYEEWTVFDNYGDVVLQRADVDSLFQLLDYVGRQNSGCTTRTIYYFDVVSACAVRRSILDTAVGDYVLISGLDTAG